MWAVRLPFSLAQANGLRAVEPRQEILGVLLLSLAQAFTPGIAER
jgi:hypothetical protein